MHVMRLVADDVLGIPAQDLHACGVTERGSAFAVETIDPLPRSIEDQFVGSAQVAQFLQGLGEMLVAGRGH